MEEGVYRKECAQDRVWRKELPDGCVCPEETARRSERVRVRGAPSPRASGRACGRGSPRGAASRPVSRRDRSAESSAAPRRRPGTGGRAGKRGGSRMASPPGPARTPPSPPRMRQVGAQCGRCSRGARGGGLTLTRGHARPRSRPGTRAPARQVHTRCHVSARAWRGRGRSGHGGPRSAGWALLVVEVPWGALGRGPRGSGSGNAGRGEVGALRGLWAPGLQCAGAAPSPRAPRLGRPYAPGHERDLKTDTLCPEGRGGTLIPYQTRDR